MDDVCHQMGFFLFEHFHYRVTLFYYIQDRNINLEIKKDL